MPTEPQGASEARPEKPEECDCCQFTMTELVYYRPNLMPLNPEGRWLCELCAGTMTSTFQDYPRQHGPELEVMKTICYVGNAILEAIKAKP